MPRRAMKFRMHMMQELYPRLSPTLTNMLEIVQASICESGLSSWPALLPVSVPSVVDRERRALPLHFDRLVEPI
ncbi:hypothetical protein ACLKA6_011479 [Drosophila palustris]